MRAVNRVHWPGKDTLACEEHTRKLQNLARTMFGASSITPLPTDSTVECTNCVNTAKAKL